MVPARGAYLGIDVGTQGIRVVAVSATGELLTARHAAMGLQHRGAVNEQYPQVWWDLLVPLLQAVASDLRDSHVGAHPLALSVTSTSGTVIPLAADNTPIHGALMYDDRRALRQAERCRAAAAERRLPDLPFGTSFGLPKIVWFVESHPRATDRIASWCHAADYLIGRLSGVWGITDPTNALKSGYDIEAAAWPSFISDGLDIPADWLPCVVPSGTRVGTLAREVAEVTGLPATVLVTTGMTDGCASQIAAGAVQPGAWNTTIGTTMVIKGVTRRLIDDPHHRLYNHQHPDGWWMPGGASNTGADWVVRDYAGQNLAALDDEARAVIPTPWLAYPLAGEGERFPFIAPHARGFEPQGLAGPDRYAARMEGVAYLERLTYETLEALSGEEVDRVYSAGGGSRSETWTMIRANVLGKPLLRMRHPEAAVGAAIVAASGTAFESLEAAAMAMTRREQVVEPGVLVEPYRAGFERFVRELTQRGYLASAESVP